MKKTCKECGLDFAGRADKKFCSNYCRANSHNKAQKVILPKIRKINKILISNRKILAELNLYGEKKVKKETLVNLGFRFNYCTNINYIRKIPYYFCYEYGYTTYSNGYCKIIQKNEVLA